MFNTQYFYKRFSNEQLPRSIHASHRRRMNDSTFAKIPGICAEHLRQQHRRLGSLAIISSETESLGVLYTVFFKCTPRPHSEKESKHDKSDDHDNQQVHLDLSSGFNLSPVLKRSISEHMFYVEKCLLRFPRERFKILPVIFRLR